MRALRLIAALALLGAAAGALPPSPPRGLEPAIERQLHDARAGIDRLSVDGAATPRDVAAAYGSLGELYLLYDLAREAESCLREAIARDAGEPRWPYLLGVVLESEGELESAAAAFRATLALRADDVPALLRLGDVSLERAQAEEARAAFERARAIEPGSAKALDGLGRVAFALGDYDQAIARFEAALALQPDASSVQYRLGMAHRARGDAQAARLHLEQGGDAPVVFPDPVLDAAHRRVTGVGASIVVGQLAARAGATAAAEARFRDAVALDPKSPEAHHALGVFYEEQGRKDEALEQYLAALDLGLANSALGLNAGRMLREAGRASDAVVVLERAAASAPDSSLLQAELAAALQAAGQPERALEAYGRALELEPDARTRALLFFHRANLLAGVQRAGDAENDLREAVRLAPDLAEAHLNLGTLCARRGDLAAAATQLERAAQLAPRNVQAQVSLGMALLLLDRPADARSRLEAAVVENPGETAIAHLLARLLASSSSSAVRDPDRALALARELVEAQPSAAHLETLAMALAAAGRFDQAIESQERAVAALESPTASGSSAGDRESARRRLTLYREQRPVVDPWKR
jgi:tetratricopeptide (TPR) repeat protein